MSRIWSAPTVSRSSSFYSARAATATSSSGYADLATAASAIAPSPAGRQPADASGERRIAGINGLRKGDSTIGTANGSTVDGEATASA